MSGARGVALALGAGLVVVGTAFGQALYEVEMTVKGHSKGVLMDGKRSEIQTGPDGQSLAHEE